MLNEGDNSGGVSAKMGLVFSAFQTWWRNVFAFLIWVMASSSFAGENSFNSYGQIGLVEMPTAESAPDGLITLSQSYFDGTLRTTFTSQIFPRLSASFRYAGHGKNGEHWGSRTGIAVLMCDFVL